MKMLNKIMGTRQTHEDLKMNWLPAQGLNGFRRVAASSFMSAELTSNLITWSSGQSVIWRLDQSSHAQPPEKEGDPDSTID